MKALFESIDLFAHKINFNYDKKIFYHSFFGIGLTFSLYSVMIYFVYYFSWDFINQRNPRVIFTETEFQSNINIRTQEIIEHANIDVTIVRNGTLDKLQKYVNKTITPEDELGYFFIYHYNQEDELEYPLTFPFSIKGFKCRRNNKLYDCYKIGTEFFKQNSIYNNNNNTNLLEEFNFTIQNRHVIQVGFQFQSYFQNLIFSKNNLEVFLSFSGHVTNSIINVNSEDFFNSYGNLFASNIKINNEKKSFENEYTTANYGVINLLDDKGFIFSQPENRTAIKKNYESLRAHSGKAKIVLYKIEIDRLMKNYNRIYRKLQNVFADLGGIMSSLILMGNIIIVQFNKKKFDYDLINKVFKIENDENEPEMGLKSKNIYDNKIFTERNRNNLSINQSSLSRFLFDNTVKNNDLRKNYNSNVIAEKNLELQTNNKVVISEPSSNSNFKRSYSSINIEMMNKDNTLNYLKPVKKSSKEEENEEVVKNLEKFNENYSKGKLFKKPLNYSKCDFLRSFLFCDKLIGDVLIKKEKLFRLAQNQIYEYMDITSYVQLFEKFDKLISVIFNENQALSFSFMRNKKISDIKENKTIEKESIVKVIRYFKDNLKELKMTQVDERLYNSFYPCLSKLI